MISICIPVYNFDVSILVKALHKQALECQIPFEILLMDDASEERFQAINSMIQLSKLQYIPLEKNIGRSKIRNALAYQSQYRYLIFLDCDSQVASDSYIADYLSFCKPGIVCYGGTAYQNERPVDDILLRWKYGVERECLSALERRKQSNFGFRTNNFLIDKEIFNQVIFNEELVGYGHEDTFFGLELFGKGIEIQHVDNPLIHLGLESADVFLKKTESGINNLHKIELLLKDKYPDFVGHSKLMRSKMIVDKLFLTKIIAILYSQMKPLLYKNLLSKNPSLLLFDLYRLGYLCSH